MLIKYLLNALFEIFTIKGRTKEIVTKIKTDVKNIKKASKILIGIITEFQLDGTRHGLFVP